MMTPISNCQRHFKVEYEQLDHLKFWEGTCLLEDQKIYRGRKGHIHRAYARVISTADWDNPAARYSLRRLLHRLYL